MTKKAKKILENKLTEICKKKYKNDIIAVKVLDKHSCKITIEIEYAKRYVDVTLPISVLC